jgi:hypothetical protein
MLTPFANRSPQIFASLVLLALVMLQISWASHENQHALDDLAEPCFLCVQLDGSNPLVPTVSKLTVEHPGQAAAVSQPASYFPQPTFATHRARAPPRS